MCTFWKVVNNRTVQFKWVAGERRLELEVGWWVGDDKPDTRPVNVTANCTATAPHCDVDKASRQAWEQT